MNKLQQEIYDELDRFEKFSTYISKEDAARIASRIVLEVAKKAYKEGKNDGLDWSIRGEDIYTFEDFKKEYE